MGEDNGTRSHRTGSVRARRAIPLAVALLAAFMLVAACGSEERQDAAEPTGEYPLEVTQAQFPTRQRLAETSDLRLTIENVGEETVPDLAVTIWTGDDKGRRSFSVRIDQPDAADPERPVWILEHDFPKLLGPGIRPADLDDEPSAGADAVQTGTFSFGAIAPGESKDVIWRLTPVMAGTFTVHYEIAAGLQGHAVAVTADGSPVEGEFVVTITDEPPDARIDDEGDVIIEGD